MLKSVLVLFSTGVLLGASGCATLYEQQRREDMRERSAIDNLRLDVNRLSEKIDAYQTAQNDLYRQIEEVRATLAADAQDLRQRLAVTEQAVKALDAAREKDREAIVDTLTKKVSVLIQTQPAPATRAASGYEHVVQRGQSLSTIAAAYNVRVDAIVKANNLSNPDAIREGQKLFIPE